MTPKYVMIIAVQKKVIMMDKVVPIDANLLKLEFTNLLFYSEGLL